MIVSFKVSVVLIVFLVYTVALIISLNIIVGLIEVGLVVSVTLMFLEEQLHVTLSGVFYFVIFRFYFDRLAINYVRCLIETFIEDTFLFESN